MKIKPEWLVIAFLILLMLLSLWAALVQLGVLR